VQAGFDAGRAVCIAMGFKRWFTPKYLQLDWIQVEISSHCNAACTYCPHTAFRTSWQNRFLPMEVFLKLVPAFSRTHLVYLQGWGEPFTHPQFFEMAAAAKRAGCTVGTTTNGTLLDRQSIERLVGQGVDVIGFSLAGTGPENDAIRKGTRIRKVLECISEVHRAKGKYKTDTPRIHIAYMLLRSGLDDLEKLPNFMRDVGVDQAVVSSLSYVTDPAMGTESTLACGKTEYVKLKDFLRDLGSQAGKQGAEIHFHVVSPLQHEFSCRENVPGSAVVGSGGDVSPCVMKQMPAVGRNTYYVDGRVCTQRNLSFGNIQNEAFDSIWRRKEYRCFRGDFLAAQGPADCRECLKKQTDDIQSDRRGGLA